MVADNIYRHFAILAFLTYWTISLLMVSKWWGGRGKTFSLHAASGKKPYIIFAATVTLETLLYMLFAFKWFVPYFKMPIVFDVLIGLVATLHFTVGIIPETKGLSKWIHRKTSYVAVLLFLPVFFIISTTHTIPLTARFLAGFYAVLELVAWGVYLTQPHRRQEDIVYQSIFISSLPITLIVATYLK